MLTSEPNLASLTLGNQNTLLHLAAKQGQTKTVKFLLEKTSADRQALNLFGQSPFQMAFQEGNLEVCELIRQSSPDSNCADDSEAFV